MIHGNDKTYLLSSTFIEIFTLFIHSSPQFLFPSLTQRFFPGSLSLFLLVPAALSITDKRGTIAAIQTHDAADETLRTPSCSAPGGVS